ncbi:XrtA/PEP-CTERM system histidine kinase PrsK [Photobacterium sanguinicancri]|uniref:XrtA/PEP-CTERM system histidine kinase PrsK n=1 Tax=Photobacterium sanguinicancri TaxID=875932 RepID=UPI0021C3340B|nr:XrtA/PEP-CTERM system histidine kinase PrsK [Photobacterium sanguinicancri]
MNILVSNLGFAFSGIGFVFLFLLLLTTKKQSLQKKLLYLICFFGVVWSLTSYSQFTAQWGIAPVLLAESCLNIALFLLLTSSLSNHQTLNKAITSSIQRGLLAALLIMASLAAIRMFSPILNLKLFLLFHLGQAIIGLWATEQLYRRTHRSETWAIKPLCLGLGVFFAYHFALYSDALLTSSIERGFWVGRGWIAVLAIPLILLTARRVSNWGSRVYVSREVIYHSTLLLVAGGYLLIMAIAGYYLKIQGQAWGSLAQSLFFALSGIVFASLFLSESFRNNLKVFITKHFFANKYEYRVEWMKVAELLDNQDNSPYDSALQAMVRPFGCEQALLAIQENNKFKIKADYQTADNHSEAQQLLSHLANPAVEHQWIIDIPQLKSGGEKTPFEINTLELPTHHPFYYVVPLTCSTGVKGVYLLSRPTSTDRLNWEDRDLMRAISMQLSVYLNVYHTNQKLAESRQFDTFNRMSAFLVHDLKNVVAQLQLINKNAIKHRHNPEFVDDAFETVESAVGRLNKVLHQLNNKRLEKQQTQSVNIIDTLQTVCEHRAVSLPKPTLQFNSTSNESVTYYHLSADADRLRNIFGHLIQNAQDATPQEGVVTVKAELKPDYFVIAIEDNGTGMSQDFIESRLFKPFDTTKGNAGMGIGAYDAKQFIEDLGGYIEVDSTLGKGTRFQVYLPVINENQTVIEK